MGWRWSWRGGGCSCRLPSAPCSTLQAHTLTSKWYPLSARGLVGPCPPPMSLHTFSCSCWIIDSSVLHAQHLPGHGSVTPNRAWLWEVLCVGLTSLECAILMLCMHPELNTIKRNPWRNCLLKQQSDGSNKDAFSAAVLSGLNCPHSLKSFPSHMRVDSRFYFLVRFMKGATTPFITMRLFQLLLWRYYVLSGVHLHPKSAELVGCHSRLPEWPCIAKDNDCHGYVKRAGVFVPGRSLKSNKPLSVCQARSHLRSLNNS